MSTLSAVPEFTTSTVLADRLKSYVAGGGHLVTTYFSGIVDENDHVLLGGYPGALRDLLGIRIEEFAPLLDGETVALDNGTVGTLWTDRIDVTDPTVTVLARYASGEQTGRAAITRRPTATGSASYVSTRLGADGLAFVVADLVAAAGVHSELPVSARGQVELTIRHHADEEFWFLVNLTDGPVEIDGIEGQVLVPTAPARTGSALTLAPRGVAVLRR
jgi:beta-galactosidase